MSKEKSMVFSDFLDEETVSNMKAEKQKNLNNDKQHYFSEITLLFDMRRDKIIPEKQFLTLYNDICDNLNTIMDELEES